MGTRVDDVEGIECSCSVCWISVRLPLGLHRDLYEYENSEEGGGELLLLQPRWGKDGRILGSQKEEDEEKHCVATWL